MCHVSQCHTFFHAVMCHFDMPLWMCHVSFALQLLMLSCSYKLCNGMCYARSAMCLLQCMSHVSSAALPCRLLPCVCYSVMQAAAMCLLQCMSHVSSAALPCRLLPCVCYSAMQAAAMCLLQCMSHVSSAALPCRLLPCVCCTQSAAAAAGWRRMALHSPTTRGRSEARPASVRFLCQPRPRQLQSQFGDCSNGSSPALPSPMERR